MYVQPYVCFNGRCEEALRFYEHAIGARVSFLFRFDEAPGPVVVPEGWCDKVMHANLQIGDSQITGLGRARAGVAADLRDFPFTEYPRPAAGAALL